MLTGNEDRTFNILLIEDYPIDLKLIKEAISQCSSYKLNIEAVEYSESVVHNLKSVNIQKSQIKPDLILLGLNSPRKYAFDILKEVKTDPDLKYIPVIILASSGEYNDMQKAYDLHANSYIARPATFDQIVKAMETLIKFWLSSIFPNKPMEKKKIRIEYLT